MQTMNTAIYSGQARTLAQCIRNHYWLIHRPLGVKSVAISVSDESGAKDVCEEAARFLRSKEIDIAFELVKQPDNLDTFPPDAHRHAPYANSVSREAICKQYWHIQRGFEFAVLQGFAKGNLIRMRCDSWFHGPIDQKFCSSTLDAIIAPSWGGFGGINDRFAIVSKMYREPYFNAFSAFGELIEKGCPMHPESLLNEAVNGCWVHENPIMFSTLRSDGTLRAPEVLISEVGGGIR